MTSGPCFAERRRHPRFRIGGRAYVVKAARPGLITDISLGGLSWSYVDRKSWPDSPAPTLDILVEERETALAGLPCRLVADIEAEHDGPDRSLALRRRRVEFGELTAEQHIFLEQLIRQHAARPLQPIAILN